MPGVNSNMAQLLSVMVNERQDDRDEQLPRVEASFNRAEG